MGVYVFEPAVLEYIPEDEYFDFPSLILKLIAANQVVNVYHFDGYWMDLGRPDDYEQAVVDFEQMKAQFLPEVE
jgi:NDP-sugar pyrophosphorylase family protein